jgi:branched-subunit amino acid transport protein
MSAAEATTAVSGLGGFSGLSLWLLFLACGLVTVCERLSFILVFGKRDMPSWLMRGLRYVPPAALSALVFPAILRPDGVMDLSLGNHRILAALAAALVAWKFKNLLWTILTGMGVLWLLGWLA